jgi:hypothetical protein
LRARAQESCAARGSRLEQSRQLHQLTRDIDHEREWIALKLQAATDHNYRCLLSHSLTIRQKISFDYISRSERLFGLSDIEGDIELYIVGISEFSSAS